MNGVRWGILGTAHIARAALVPAIRAASNGSLAAVASRDAERARSFAAAAEIPRHHGSYEALLDDGEVDALYIPLPNSLHRQWTVRALERGKHVLCEKPLALDEEECRDMEATAVSCGRLLMEAFMYRFHPRTERLLELVRGGAIGEPRAIRSTFTFRLTRPGNIRLDPDLGGGALMDVGCYCVNASRTLAGAEPVEAQAFAAPAPSGVDQRLSGALRFEDGLVARFDCALDLERRETLEIGGTEGTLVVPDAFLPGTADAAIHELRGREGAREHVVEGADEYRLMAEHFGDCVLSSRPVRYPPSEAALNMRTIEALYRSAAEGGTPVRV